MSINKIIGKTIVEIKGEDEIIFSCSDATKFRMYHFQDCCENVSVDCILGDVNNLLNSPVNHAEETHPDIPCENLSSESFTWTDFRIITEKGEVIYRWLGVSNGYYGETPEFEELK